MHGHNFPSLRIFLEHRRQCASEFDVEEFFKRMQHPAGSPQRPHPGFINAIFLLACWFHHAYDLTELEAHFLAKTRDGLSASLLGMDRLLDYVRGVGLLSLYHYGRGNMLEGYEDVCRAAHIGKTCGLDKIKSHVWRDPVVPMLVTRSAIEGFRGNFKSTEYLIPLSSNSKDLGERIHAFWSVWIVDASGSATHGLERLFDDMKITTPLPLPISYYSNGCATEENCRTLAHFWATEGATDQFDPPFTHRIKATSVLEAACRLSRLSGGDAMGDVWQSVPSKPIEPLGTEAFEEEFGRVSRTCFHLHERLPNVAIAPLTTQDVVNDWYRSQIDPVMIHAHALTLCALMTLYDIKSKVDESASNIALEAAIHMVGVCRRIIDLDFLQLDIMLGVCLIFQHSFLCAVDAILHGNNDGFPTCIL